MIERRHGLPILAGERKGIPALHECGECGAPSNPDDPNGHVHTVNAAGASVVGKRRDVERAAQAKTKQADAARAAEMAAEKGPMR